MSDSYCERCRNRHRDECADIEQMTRIADALEGLLELGRKVAIRAGYLKPEPESEDEDG